jgi:hypothetical protein
VKISCPNLHSQARNKLRDCYKALNPSSITGINILRMYEANREGYNGQEGGTRVKKVLIRAVTTDNDLIF